VVFGLEGPLKSDYRRFNIEGLAPGDDYGAMNQALTRRYARIKRGEVPLPDVLLIDGGAGQLAEAIKVIETLEIPGVTLIGVAKGSDRRAGQERLFLAGQDVPTILPADSSALHLIQRIRDEAHRFAITGHRQRRGKARRESILEGVPGLGPAPSARAPEAIRRAARRDTSQRGRFNQGARHQPQARGAHFRDAARRMSFPIANWLTLARIAMIPLVVLFFFTPQHWADTLAAIIFIAAAITDSLDGYLARRLGQTSALGAFLDPVADKLMVSTALILLVTQEPPSLELVRFNPHLLITLTAAVIVGREITISALREWMAEVGARGKVAVSILGKLKTIFQMTGLSLMLFRGPVWGLPLYELGVYCLVAAAVLTLWSMIAYLRAAWPELMRST